MEEAMVEDNANEEEDLEYTFTAYEIDIDYEFDAARFFDFVGNESCLEVRQAEDWFESAGSYPPSPFVLKLVPQDEALKGNVNISPKSKGMGDIDLMYHDSDIEVDEETSSMDASSTGGEQTLIAQQIPSNQRCHAPSEDPCSGLTLYSQIVNKVIDKKQTKSSMKPSFQRISTLMKPTASQLAKQLTKQNHTLRDNYPRANTSSVQKANLSSTGACGIENQAAKRQKLASGCLRKVQGVMQLQQISFVHKAPKREGLLSGSTTQIKAGITIPREPDLETANRAHRTRPKSNKEVENAALVVRRFKALPLNRKILEAPQMIPKRSTPCTPSFQEFHLKTSERATQHSSAFSKSTVHCDHPDEAWHKYSTGLTSGSKEPSSIISTKKPDSCGPSHTFKALPLNKKILTSKGDIGVFRNIKKETTVPLEFNFQSGKKSHPNPPIDLFNKLSLASDKQEIVTKVPHSAGISLKGPKENRGWFEQRSEIKQLKTPKPARGIEQQ